MTIKKTKTIKNVRAIKKDKNNEKTRTKTIKNYKGYKKGQRQSKRDKAKMSEVFICRESD